MVIKSKVKNDLTAKGSSNRCWQINPNEGLHRISCRIYLHTRQLELHLLPKQSTFFRLDFFVSKRIILILSEFKALFIFPGLFWAVSPFDINRKWNGSYKRTTYFPFYYPNTYLSNCNPNHLFFGSFAILITKCWNCWLIKQSRWRKP